MVAVGGVNCTNRPQIALFAVSTRSRKKARNVRIKTGLGALGMLPLTIGMNTTLGLPEPIVVQVSPGRAVIRALREFAVWVETLDPSKVLVA